ncbi:hypothetical protein SAMN04489740_0982 [Arthrobacter alpinus]|uniref:Uncharacterized protein n=1 Tax=Arthrobacter alpinus TaxID=656366 RepID=A0A1H5HCF4_9MICC|nr:hypothetical protein SAMN04489740_0982 [Arthrobacter alpinus]
MSLIIMARLRLRVQAHAAELSRAVVSQTPSQIRNRLAYLVANTEALLDIVENEET